MLLLDVHVFKFFAIIQIKIKHYVKPATAGFLLPKVQASIAAALCGGFLKQSHRVSCKHIKSVHQGVHQITQSHWALTYKTMTYAHTKHSFQKYQLIGRRESGRF
jgi:hypothetical protein